MRVASRYQMKCIDESLFKRYTIEELVDKASDCLMDEVKKYHRVVIVCGNGNNGADGFSLALSGIIIPPAVLFSSSILCNKT